MKYKEIVSVTGVNGLFQLIRTKSDGAIVRNLAERTTKFISARQHNVTPLESIEIYTTGSNVRLHEVLQKMKDSSAPKPEGKNAANDEIKQYFTGIFPEIDTDRVYVSDMKKMIRWFDILQQNDLLDFSESMAQQEENSDTIEAEDGVAAAKTAPEAEAQLAEEAKPDQLIDTAATDAAADATEKPAKKARAKKATAETADGEEAPAKKTAARKKKEEGDNAAADGEEAPKKATRAAKKKED